MLRYHPDDAPGRFHPLYVTLLVLAGLLVGATYPVTPEWTVPANPAPRPEDVAMTALETRAARLADQLADLDGVYQRDIAPLARTLTLRGADRRSATRLAMLLVREGRDAGLDPRLLLSVLLVEDPALDSAAVSFVGAVGLMQVMPFHAGQWGCPDGDLRSPDVNICHGARILAHQLRRAKGNMDLALLRYNGCVHGTNTPDCDLYPLKVYRRAGEVWLHEQVAQVF